MTAPALDSIEIAQSMNNGNWNQYWNTLSKYTGDEPNNPEQWFEWQRRNAHARTDTGGPDGME